MNLEERKSALKPLAVSVASALLAMQSIGANAASFEVGDFDITFDSTFSAGAAWRVEDRDFENLVGKSNNQTFNWAGYKGYAPFFSNTEVWNSYGNYSTNGDMGNLNYDPGETFSEVIKGFHELQISSENYGAVVSFMYYKDFAAKGIGYKGSSNSTAFDPCRDSEAKELLCEDFRFLDAYVWADFDFNDGMNPVSIRVGEQVLSWGESTLIPHGINVSPVDIARLKAPGADLKEAFIPTGMVWTNIGLTDSLSLEAFYQYEWQETYLPVAGSYFSTNDFAAAGGQYNNIQLNFASNPDLDQDTLMAELDALGQAVAAGQMSPTDAGNAYVGGYATKFAVRAHSKDEEAKDSGQFGIKLGWFAEELNFTEFGFYYINYHSRRPLISGGASDFGAQAIAQDITTLVGAQSTGGITEDQLYNLNAFTKGVIVFPEDIKLYGASFTTTVGNTALSGEISYREGEPIQIDDTELLFAAMPEQVANAGLNAALAGISQIGDNEVEGCDLPIGGAQPGQTAQGYCRMDVTQMQMTAVHMFGPTLFFDNLTFVGEVGAVQIHDMPDQEILRFNAPGTPRSGSTAATTANPNGDIAGFVLQSVQNGEAPGQTFATDSAWGYRMILAGEINGAIGNLNLKPKLTWSHDVDGITPDPLFLFHEDKKSVGVMLDIESQSNWSIGMAYNAFYDGVGNINEMADRDYVSLSFKYSL